MLSIPSTDIPSVIMKKNVSGFMNTKKEEAVLATTGDFYTITGTDLNRIIARLEIDYAQV